MKVQRLVLIVIFALLAYLDGQASNKDCAVMGDELTFPSDSMIISEGYTVLIHRIKDEEKIEELRETYELYNPAKPLVVTSFDSAKVFFKSDVKLQFKTYSWDPQATLYIGTVISRNGMKVIFRGLVSFQRYYPDEDVIVLSNGIERIINLKTGEDEYDPKYIRYSQNRHFRSAFWVYGEEVTKFELQFYDKKKKCYRPLSSLCKFIEQTGFATSNCFWQGDILYLWTDWGLIEIMVVNFDKKEKKNEL